MGRIEGGGGRVNMKYPLFLIVLLAIARAGLLPLTTFAGGEEVVVVYNTRLPESKALANYYARKRDVPKEHVFGFKLTTSEEISRAEFRDELQRPLAKRLETQKLWHIGGGELPGTNGRPVRVRNKVVESKIRYLVLCYGVPLKILRDGELHEAGEETLRPEFRRNEAAVDSELACLPRLYQSPVLTGPSVNPLFGATNATWLHPTNGVLIVARLDAPTPELARGLVDKALHAEADGLWGRAYFDLRNITEPAYKPGDDWLREAAQVARQVGFDTIVDENPNVWPASFPMDNIALYMGWYLENVTGPFTRPHVEFMPGAFAYHLHSYSAASLRTTNNNWTGPLLAKGATCTMGTVDEPYLGGTPEVGVFAGRWLYNGFTFGEAACAAQPVLSWQTTVVGDPLYRPFGKLPLEVQAELEHRKSKFIEWSILRLVNLALARGANLTALTVSLEDTPTTRNSAVLTAKLGDFYAAQGKPASAIAAYQRALKLDPSPQQRLGLRLTLGEKLLAENREEEARKNYEQLLAEMPDYPDKEVIQQRLANLAPSGGN
jgi:uncharacterized protein (TIGR03790 family)